MWWNKPKKDKNDDLIVRFFPTRDITAYELALIVKYTNGNLIGDIIISRIGWLEMPKVIKDHFSEF